MERYIIFETCNSEIFGIYKDLTLKEAEDIIKNEGINEYMLIKGEIIRDV